MHFDPLNYDRPAEPAFLLTPVENHGAQRLPESFRDKVLVLTVHDGAAIPRKYRFHADGSPMVDPERLAQAYIEGRDWGANSVAEAFAAELGVPGYARCRIARVLLDFNRFPGSTPPGRINSLDSLAISSPFAEVLNHPQKAALLEDYYDPISNQIEEIIADKLVNVSIHTYDPHHPSTTERADLSLITLPRAYQLDARMNYGIFDPMYPDVLAESTCSRVLRDQISLDLERAGFRVSHNHPYAMPDGSIELRSQVWFFFRYLRERFEEAFPGSRADGSYQKVWSMLLDTNLRMQQPEALRGYLHRFRRVDASQAQEFARAQAAYEDIRGFLRHRDIATDFRRSPFRPSSLGIEVRKDLLSSFDPDTGIPVPPTPNQQGVARLIGQVLAGAVISHCAQDHRAR